MGKTVWYINPHSGGPGLNGAYRAYELASRWQTDGHDVKVVLASFNDSNQSNHMPPSFVIDRVRYITVRTCRYRGNGGSRLLSMALFAWRLNFVAINSELAGDKPDAIIYSTVHPFGIFAAKRLARKHNARLVFEIRDFWPLTLIELLGVHKWHPFVLLCGFAERFAAKHSDLISSVLPRAKLYFEDNKIPIKDFFWAPNGFSPLQHKMPKHVISENFQSASEFLENSRQSGKTIFVYAGALGPPNAVGRLLEAFMLLPLEIQSCIAFICIGGGVQRKGLESEAKQLKSISSHFSGKLSKEETQLLLQNCDIGYAGGTYNPKLYKYGISPNKIASYLDAELPVLLPMEPCGDPISEYGVGLAAPFETSEKLMGGVLELLNMDKRKRSALGKKGKKHLLKQYNYDSIAEDYLRRIFNT